MKIVMPLAAALFVALPAVALAAEDEAKSDAKPDPSAVTCKYTLVVDSRIPQRVCMTNFEWEDRQRAQMESKRSGRNRNSSCGDSGSC